MARANPVQFIQQVRAEAGKISWSSRREVIITTIMVLLLATFAALFFSLVDISIRFILETVLNLFRG